MRRLTLALLLCAPLAAAPPGVAGSVTNSVTGAAVKKVLLTLRAEDNRSAYQTLTDAAGHFQFDDVAPGNYQITPEAQGFVREPRAFIASRHVVVAAGQRVKDVAVRLIPFGAISGTIVDENGEPVIGADVFAVRYRFRP